ncbi:MAG: hypothetical protein PHU83_07915 [Eubacteriales bacterium]|nr:hypothetical protein [Eubacteriales bacterium]
MMRGNWNRYNSDVDYDLLVSPFGLDFYNMTPKQAGANFEWFISIIPKRMEYFRNRCASDLKISVETLDYSAESLILVWRWFLKTARMEKTPKETLEKMKEGAKVLGESFINWEQFTVATQFIMKDIGMYIGQSYVLNYPQLRWHYYTKPKNEINAKQPVIAGFYFKDQYTEGEATINPLEFAEGAAANFFDKTQKETDIYDSYMQWVQWIPKQT